MKEKGDEIRSRLPRLVMNLIMAIIFWLMSVFIPPTLGGVLIPGIEIEASFLIWILMRIVMGIFLVRVLSDALILGDIFTDVFVSKMGIKEGRTPKRAAREVVYIIVIVLVITAINPLLSTIQDYGFYLATAITYIGLGLVIVFIYDLGRILYTIIENKAESIAEQLTKKTQKQKDEKRG
jgi:cation transport ATPase